MKNHFLISCFTFLMLAKSVWKPTLSSSIVDNCLLQWAFCFLMPVSLYPCLIPGRLITFETVAEDVFEDGCEIDELLRWVIYGLGCVFLQQRFYRKPVCRGEREKKRCFKRGVWLLIITSSWEYISQETAKRISAFFVSAYCRRNTSWLKQSFKFLESRLDKNTQVLESNTVNRKRDLMENKVVEIHSMLIPASLLSHTQPHCTIHFQLTLISTLKSNVGSLLRGRRSCRAFRTLPTTQFTGRLEFMTPVWCNIHHWEDACLWCLCCNIQSRL